MQPQIVDPTTTIRRYSLVVEAGKREDEARNAWKAAYREYARNDTEENRQKFISASRAYEQARMDYLIVTRKVFPQ